MRHLRRQLVGRRPRRPPPRRRRLVGGRLLRRAPSWPPASWPSASSAVAFFAAVFVGRGFFAGGSGRRPLGLPRRRRLRRLALRPRLAGVSDGRRAVTAGRTGEERGERALGEDHVVADEHVVGVELVRRDQVDRRRRCAGSSRSARRCARAPPGRAGCDAILASVGRRRLGRRRVAVDERGDDVQPAAAGPVGQGAAQRGGLHLLRGALRVVARRRAVDDATAGELRRAGRALTGAAGALLAVRLLPPPRTSPRVLVSCVPWRAAASWATTTWWISGMLICDVEDLGRQLDGAGLTSPVGDCTVDGGHQRAPPRASGALAAVRTSTSAPLGPGNGALDQQQALLGVDRVDVRFCMVVRDATHPAGHPHALEHAARGGAGADRARRAVLALRRRDRRPGR